MLDLEKAVYVECMRDFDPNALFDNIREQFKANHHGVNIEFVNGRPDSLEAPEEQESSRKKSKSNSDKKLIIEVEDYTHNTSNA